MFVIYNEKNQKVPIKIWLKSKNDIEESCLTQALEVSNHPCIFHHLSLMPDTHMGYALPIGGVVALKGAVVPYYAGVDIGCGMCFVRTDTHIDTIKKSQIKSIIDLTKKTVPTGFSHHARSSKEYRNYKEWIKNWIEEKMEEVLFSRLKKILGIENKEELINYLTESLGTLGQGNHFCEIQGNQDGFVCLMIHSGSRNLGYKIANFHTKLAQKLNEKWHSAIPTKDSAFLPTDTQEGKDYLKDMNFALEYARENRNRIMNCFKSAVSKVCKNVEFLEEINIHHNFIAIENHFGKNVWVHRKGATQAKKGQLGIIPGSMGTSSYIVRGLGNPESYYSCSHGAGRKMGRKEASRKLTKKSCDKAMKGIIFDGFKEIKLRGKKAQKITDLGEAPQAYKDIDEVMENQKELVEIVQKLTPVGVLKG